MVAAFRGAKSVLKFKISERLSHSRVWLAKHTSVANLKKDAAKVFNGHLKRVLEVRNDPEDNIWRTLWLGGSDLRKYQEWFWFSTGEDMKYSNFKVGEPNDLAGEERCLEMVANMEWNYEWNDQSCCDTMGFICEYFV